jgi:hypothetical protein
VIPAVLVVTLALCVAFVWRAGPRWPALTVFAAAGAAVLAVLLIRKPIPAAIVLALVMALIYLPRRRGGP